MFETGLTEKQALEGFDKGIDCSQAVFAEFATQLGMERQAALDLAAPFGGGMWHGENCGCVVGALLAIALKYSGQNKKEEMLKQKAKFEEAFAAKYGSCMCKQILGYDVSKEAEMEKIKEEKLFEKTCCKAVVDACGILKELFNA